MLDNNNITLSALDMLKVAFQADGSFSSRKSKYTGERTGTIAIRFHLKKERKKIRLKYILNLLDFEFSWEEYDNGYCSCRIKLPVAIFKSFSKNLDIMFKTYNNKPWCIGFIEELSYWDGTRRKGNKSNNIGYTSVISSNITFVQSIATLCGYTATFNCYKDKRTDYNRKPIYTTNINLRGNNK